MKKINRKGMPYGIPWNKVLYAMRLTVFFFFVSTFTLIASGTFSQNKTFTISMQNALIKDVLQEIEDRSGYFFIYNNEFVDVYKKISINARDKDIYDLLDVIFRGQDVAYSINERRIILSSSGKSNVLKQQRSVSGKVTDASGNPIPGVTVVVKGSTTGTITSIDGTYSVAGVSDDATLVFSFVGMRTREVPVAGRMDFSIIMEEDLIGIEEVVAVGYGTVKKSDLTGSVSRVTSERMRELAATQITESLSGTVAGLYTTQNSSASGGGSMEIRGPSSISAISEPLIVLDGAIYSGSLSDINPADIETIDILKDASSAAIFGSRAAAGVIIATTKRGMQGKPVINFSARVGLSGTTNDFYPYGMDPDGDPMEYFNMHRDNLYQRSNGSLPYYYYWRPENLPGDLDLSEWLGYVDNPHADPLTEWFNRMGVWPIERENYLAGKTTNFYDLVIGTGLRHDYNLSVSGATENLNYYWSVGYLNSEGIIKGDQFSVIRSRINLDLKVTDWLKVGTSTQFSYRDEGGVKADLVNLSYMSPYGSMWEEDGSLRWYPNDYTAARNPLLDYYGTDRLRDINALFSNLYAELSLPLGISYRISFQPNLSFLKEANYYSTNTFTGKTTYTGGYGYRIHTNTFQWMFDNLIKWNRTFGVHGFDLTLLSNAEKNQSWTSEQYASNFSPNENLTYHALQFGANQSLSDEDTQNTGDALMARLNYTLFDKYLFTASIRRDGYSAFGQTNPRATFPAFAFAWKVSEESFFHSKLINRLKLRLSWGQNGNREIGAYSALAQMASIQYYNGSSIETGVYNTTLANPNLRWERTESFNVGLDAGLLENRIDLSLDVYDATTKDLLLSRQLPKVTGFSSIMSNLGRLGNRGIEITLNTINYSHPNFSWKSALVFSFNRNKIKELWGDYGEYKLLNKDEYGELPDFENNWFPGQALDVVWDYDRQGIWQVDEADEAAKYELEPGDYKVHDVNGDYAMTHFEDKKFIGYTKPRHRWGFTNEFTLYKNFTATVFVRADLGHIRVVPVTNDKSTHDRRNDWAWGYWSPENPDSEFAKIDYPDNLSRYGDGLIVYKPTGFLRVQDVNLSYNLPANRVHDILSIQNMRLFLTARNLLTITNWPGFDPEASGTTPMPRTVTLGVDITL